MNNLNNVNKQIKTKKQEIEKLENEKIKNQYNKKLLKLEKKQLAILEETKEIYKLLSLYK